jgi:GNAT superfamily N-acetyltransferase
MRLAWQAGSATPGWRVRRTRFEEVPEVLRLIERAIERGCGDHYSAAQRRAVFLGYAQTLFLEVMMPFDTVVAEVAGRIVGAAQLDLSDGRLRALFVESGNQGHGHGRELLAWVERRARARRLPRLHGAMSLNAVPFYAHAGFQPCSGNRLLTHGRENVPVLPMEKKLVS